ncbi:MAG: uroporphyrinogen-III C-methyltransferase [Firmicutes bacterium]|nr:uroporphyrinogen-III C-methyltransferase [Bacillota bacterium]
MSKVYLLGAGPGDIALTTLKTIEVLKKADCVLYDRLVNPKLLDYCSKNTEILFVGKQKGHHYKKQAEINALLLEKIKTHKIIARLKGGDPYVFGRGSEEASFLYEHGIDFEVVPGISSSVAVCTYAGIPITHRDLSRAFHVYSAHTSENKLANIDFDAIAKSEETHIFLMGLTKLNQIVEKLVSAGKRKDCPIAILSKGTTPDQKVLVSTLENVLEDFEKNPLESPAIIVVGEVIALRDSLNFYERKPLFGKKYFFPKVNDVPANLTNLLEEQGAHVKEIVVSKCVKKEVEYTSSDYLVFSSKNSVNFFFENLLNQQKDIRSLWKTKICALGKMTQKELLKYGIKADIVPKEYTSQSLEEELLKVVNKEDVVCIPKDEDVKDKWLGLEQACQVQYLLLYKKVEQEYECCEYPNILCTCSSSVQNILSKHDYPKDTVFYSIGPRTSETIRKFGYTNIVESKEHSYQGMYETILEREGK